MIIKGRVWKFGDNINTDLIIPARYLSSTDPGFLAAHVMEDADPTFASRVAPGDIIVGGKDFGSGSSREHAPIALRAAGIACVVAKGFARIFYRNAFNMGLPIFVSPDLFDLVEEGDVIEVDAAAGRILIPSKPAAEVAVAPIPPFMRDLLAAGGLIPYLTKGVGR
ncbi:MAG TPA: 3-isopropylmalate dehydratase small subunit [Syntrophales bacterium]|nr:3-isopropylmalate dehydratase small subunit [Syntrophales bacterium]HOM06106.1 3-isopropylmalate dehydratase small subunit [Syntrophales bacterium]HON99030.1 3-isopropylmalate dehydratase small subunit [Syntrophales bacterium]HPC00506.1 3-isopropylmalate dehydratase small subunit [Syntrophales bacterium]HPQ05589.1 3-isopropylmalate dehydratase small subunit [Syntrophales bacterium]